MACNACCSVRVLFFVSLLCGAFVIVTFILAFVVFPDVLNNEINKATRLEEGTVQYDRFIELPFPVDFKVYIFNIENPEEILNGTKPKITEKGPFIYKQYRHKIILETDDEEDTVTYTQYETFEFDSEASSPLTDDDVVTVLNPALMSIYHLSEEFSLAGAVDSCIKSTFPEGLGQMFIKIKVRQLLFEGLNFCRNKQNDLCSLVNDIVCAVASTKRNSDVLPDYSLQFSFLNYKIKAPDGRYTVKRGIKDINTLGHIVAWNYMKYTNYWGAGTQCSKVKGTDSTLYPPRISKDNTFSIFSTDICRHVEIDYLREDSYKGINGYLFGTNPKTLMSSTSNSTDDCYCSMLSKDVDGKKSCFLDGVIDMQACFGVPVLFSFPHFLWADEKYLNGVDGMKPDENIHKTFLLVEPNTGIPLNGVKRIQLNAVLRPITGIVSLQKTYSALLPLLWIEEGVALSDKYIDELNASYFDKVVIVDAARWTLVGLSLLFVVVSLGFLIRKRFYK